jgi:excisionase family DNA binding protein
MPNDGAGGPSQPRMRPWLFFADVAAEVGVSISTVRHWARVGKLLTFRPGRRRMVRRSDLDAFLTGAKNSARGSRT